MRKICVVTGSRADYGLLYWLMKEIQADRELTLQLVVTGMHLSPEFGLTWRSIEGDGFSIDEKVEMLLSSDTPAGVTKSLGLGVIGFADALERLRPDILVLLGDRFEILAPAQAALIARIPVAHIHGGETTLGAVDESIRHALTKMSYLHFVAAEPYRRRVIQLGEAPDRVFTVGAPGIENIRRLPLLDRQQLARAINFELGDSCLLVTCHPATLGSVDPTDVMQSLLDALDRFPACRLLFTMFNADCNGNKAGQLMKEYIRKNSGRAVLFNSMGQIEYLSAVRNLDAVVGNSSSGIIEAPVCKTPTVNIGPRQSGRLKADSVIDCDENADSIAAALSKALSPGFREVSQRTVSLYGDGDTSGKIVHCLKQAKLDTAKRFYDL